MLMTMDHVDC